MTVWLQTLASVVLVSLISFVGLVFLSRGRGNLDALVMYLVSLAAGALLGGAFFHLIPEAYDLHGGSLALPLYLLSGFLGFFFIERFLWAHHHGHGSEPRAGRETKEPKDGGETIGRLRPVVLMSLLGDGFHNLIDGMVIAAAYSVSLELGLVTTGAVLLHEVPQEAGEFGVLVKGGLPVRKALLFNFLMASMAVVGAALALSVGAGSQAFLEALMFNPDLEIDPTERARAVTAATIFQAAMRSVGSGQGDLAKRQVLQAAERDPARAESIRRDGARTMADSAVAFAERGRALSALELLEGATDLAEDEVLSWDHLNAVCWFGALWEYGPDVLHICERAVSETPREDPRLYQILDSRAVALVQVGDFDKAIQDFEAYIAKVPSATSRAQRQSWVEQLNDEKSPLTIAVLRSLR